LIEDLPLPDRLINGARILGTAWRSGDRCEKGWSLESADADGEEWICACPKRTRFCKAKVQWLTLAIRDGRIPEPGSMALAVLMNAAEWDVTGVAMTMDLGAAGSVKVGTGPKAAISRTRLERLSKEAPETLAAVLKVTKIFPGTTVVNILEPEPAGGLA
jgi:hypothetical protein